MFTRITANHIASDAGFAVRIIGRTGILYTDHDRSMRIDSELLASDNGIAVYPSSIKRWDSPHDGVDLSADEASAIADSVREALIFVGFDPAML